MIKKISVIGMIVFLTGIMAFFSSCTSKEQRQIVGTWELKGDSLSQGTGQVWVFKRNDECVIYWANVRREGEYEVEENSLHFNVDDLIGDFLIVEIDDDIMELSGMTCRENSHHPEHISLSLKKLRKEDE